MPRCQKTPEGYVQSAILELLQLEHIWHVRLNSRTVHLPGWNGKMRPVYFGSPGMADILATPIVGTHTIGAAPLLFPGILWIECKAPDGKQSPAQKLFEAAAREAGHHYLRARGVDELREWLQEHHNA
ncbi:MAG TPA: hypothetical protein VHX13_04200 [Acidobacteriaceae bacterium]|jgi:hypothetical protein|nr:hypothetical protein [Acidobacteriaceae bacterium]